MVSVLFSIGRPAAILRAVAFIVIDTINRRFGCRARPHVFEKLRKVVMPLLTNGDASCSVVFIPFFVRVIATLKDVLPSLIFRRSAKSMFGINFNSLLISKTAARNANALKKFVPTNAGDVSTLAQTAKLVGVIRRHSSQIFNHRPSPELVSNMYFHEISIALNIMFWTGLAFVLWGASGKALL